MGRSRESWLARHINSFARYVGPSAPGRRIVERACPRVRAPPHSAGADLGRISADRSPVANGGLGISSAGIGLPLKPHNPFIQAGLSGLVGYRLVARSGSFHRLISIRDQSRTPAPARI